MLTARRWYNVGQRIHGYTVKKTQHIPELSLNAIHLENDTTTSQHLHLSTKDTNNVFSIAFKTNPPDSTGTPHILEHITLCGSKSYPVRDPFFKMTNRSLSNFMNAMTGHDYTFYPFATTNHKDFDNLLQVYLSLVFEPLLQENDFLQEGWRLENSDNNDVSSPLQLKGVVFNEMKGQYSNSNYFFYVKFLQSIYPLLNNSGGDPMVIPFLKYTDLRKFHHDNYHPANSKTFTYGDIPLESHLEKLEKYQVNGGEGDSATSKFFNLFESDSSSTSPSEVKYPIIDFDKTVHVYGPVDSMSTKSIDSQYKSSITWNLGDSLDESNFYKIFKWKILSSLLCDGHSSIFYQEFIEKNLADDFSPNTGFDNTTALLSFSLGFSNITEIQSKSLEVDLINIFNQKVLPDLHQKKNIERVEALLHQIEFNLKKHKPDFGLGLLSSLIPNWINGVDPIKSLQIEQIIQQFKSDFGKNKMQIFADLINSDILKNDQKFRFIMKPDEQYGQKLVDKEKEITEDMVSKLDEKDREIIYKRGLELAKVQGEEQNTDILPTLTMDDIPRQGSQYPIEHSKINNKELQKRVVDTNGIVHVNAVKNIDFLPVKYYPYLGLFNSCLTNLAGTSNTLITDLETKIQRYTGGVSFGSRIHQDPHDIHNIGLQYTLNGKALSENSNHIFELWYEILNETKFDANDDVVDKLSTLIKSMGQNQLNTIADRGHSYASGDSSSRLTIAKYVSNIFGGLSHVQFIHELNTNLEKNGKEYLKLEVLPILQDIQKLIIENNSFRYRIVGDSNIVQGNELLAEQFDQKFKSVETKANELKKLTEDFNQNKLGIESDKKLINLPYQVGYASLTKTGVEYTNKDGSVLQILAQLLTFKHLHSVIREQNGAYGGGLNYDGLGGLLNFYSYRDPNPLNSIKSFEDCNKKLLEFTEKDIQEAKLRIFQSVDAPTNISTQGSSQFFDNITDEMRQERREQFLDTTRKDIEDAFTKYIQNSESSVSVIGDNEILKVSSDWKVKKLNV